MMLESKYTLACDFAGHHACQQASSLTKDVNFSYSLLHNDLSNLWLAIVGWAFRIGDVWGEPFLVCRPPSTASFHHK